MNQNKEATIRKESHRRLRPCHLRSEDEGLEPLTPCPRRRHASSEENSDNNNSRRPPVTTAAAIINEKRITGLIPLPSARSVSDSALLLEAAAAEMPGAVPVLGPRAQTAGASLVTADSGDTTTSLRGEEEGLSKVVVPNAYTVEDQPPLTEERVLQLVAQQMQEVTNPPRPPIHTIFGDSAAISDTPVPELNDDDDGTLNSANNDKQEERNEDREGKWSYRTWINVGALILFIFGVGAAIGAGVAVSSHSSSSDTVVNTSLNFSTNVPESTSPTLLPDDSSARPQTTNPTELLSSSETPTITPKVKETVPPTLSPSTTNRTHLRTPSPSTTTQPSPPINSAWNQRGQDLDGEAAGDHFGLSVDLSADGMVLAAGAYTNSGSGNKASGHVRAYSYDTNTSTWKQRGQDLDGEDAGDNFGWSVALSASGSILAAGAIWNDGYGYGSGHVRVYSYNEWTSRWAQLGQDLNGEDSGDEYGMSVALSSEGTVMAAGGHLNDGNGVDAGYVRVYSFDADASTWVQMGQDLNGDEQLDEFGFSVALSTKGNILATGARFNDGGGLRSGHVRVYSYNISASEWSQMGQDLNGEAPGDRFGWSVALSAKGTILAVGGVHSDGNGLDSGHVRIYSYDSDTTKWAQMGQDLDGEATGDRLGWSAALSADGTVLAAGAAKNDGNGDLSGHARVYSYNSETSEWVQIGEDLDGEDAGDEFGSSVSLSADGTALAVGGGNNDGNGMDSGHARVFEWSES